MQAQWQLFSSLLSSPEERLSTVLFIIIKLLIVHVHVGAYCTFSHSSSCYWQADLGWLCFAASDQLLLFYNWTELKPVANSTLNVRLLFLWQQRIQIPTRKVLLIPTRKKKEKRKWKRKRKSANKKQWQRKRRLKNRPLMLKWWITCASSSTPRTHQTAYAHEPCCVTSITTLFMIAFMKHGIWCWCPIFRSPSNILTFQHRWLSFVSPKSPVAICTFDSSEPRSRSSQDFNIIALVICNVVDNIFTCSVCGRYYFHVLGIVVGLWSVLFSRAR